MDDEEIPFPSNDNQILTNLTKDQSRERLRPGFVWVAELVCPSAILSLSKHRRSTCN